MSPIPRSERSGWFFERFELAANQIIEYFGSNFVNCKNASIADIGCGDGIIDLGLFRKAAPARLVGFDVLPVDSDQLSELAVEHGVPGEIPPGLTFVAGSAEELPAAGESFDLAFSWSAFHHFPDPARAAREIARILRPGGTLMIQLYPFFTSPHGSLLEPWFTSGYAQLMMGEEVIADKVRSDPHGDPAWEEHLLGSYGKLNRVGLDGLGEMLKEAGLRVTRLQVMGEDAPIPPEIAAMPLSQLGVAGVKLLAVRT